MINEEWEYATKLAENERREGLIKDFFTKTWYANPEQVHVQRFYGPGLETRYRVYEEITLFDRLEIANEEEIGIQQGRLDFQYSEPSTKYLGEYLFEANTSDFEELIKWAAADIGEIE